MKHAIIISATSVLLLLTRGTQAQHSADSMAIQSLLEQQVRAWNAGDAHAYSNHFAENGTFTNILGMFFTGHQQFFERHVEIFKGMFAKTAMRQDVASFRFLNPDVAIVETFICISGLSAGTLPKAIHIDDKGHLYTRLLQVFQKQAGNWKIVAYHNIDVKTGIPAPASK